MRADLRVDRITIYVRGDRITIYVYERNPPHHQAPKLVRAQICAPSSALCVRVNMSKIVTVTIYNQGDAANEQDITEERPEDRT
jgi:hypothetical protein